MDNAEKAAALVPPGCPLCSSTVLCVFMWHASQQILAEQSILLIYHPIVLKALSGWFTILITQTTHNMVVWSVFDLSFLVFAYLLFLAFNIVSFIRQGANILNK